MVSQYLRFRDLQARGIIASWPILRRRVDHDGFPSGRKTGPNTRIWTEDEVNAWIASRPTERKIPHPRRADAEVTDTCNET
jgi:predicted DNA-binding transcriptional regulator AlpA